MHSVTQGDVTKSGSRVPTRSLLMTLISVLIPGFRRLSFRRFKYSLTAYTCHLKMSMSGEQMKEVIIIRITCRLTRNGGTHELGAGIQDIEA
eukprot:794863-Amorphochlora_amoeboformis.AAC.1